MSKINQENLQIVWNGSHSITLEDYNHGNLDLWISFDLKLKEIRFCDRLSLICNKEKSLRYDHKNLFSTNQILIFVESTNDPIIKSLYSILSHDHNNLLVGCRIKKSVFIENTVLKNFDLKIDNFNIFRFYYGQLNFAQNYLDNKSISNLLDNQIDIMAKNYENMASRGLNEFNSLFRNENRFSYEYCKYFKTGEEFKVFHENATAMIRNVEARISGASEQYDRAYEYKNRGFLFLKVGIRFQYHENRKVGTGVNNPHFLTDYFKKVLKEKIERWYNHQPGSFGFSDDDNSYQDNLDAFEGDYDAYFLWQNE